MSEEKADLTINEDAMWQALTRSKQLRDMLERIAQEIAQEASNTATVVAYDEGWLAKSYKGTAVSAKALQRRAREASDSRRRRGQRGTNRYLDYMVKDTPGTSYEGQLGIAYTGEYTARLVEYGSVFHGPRRILLGAAEKVAQKYNIEIEVSYDRTHNADPSRVAEINRTRAQKPRGDDGGGAQ